MAAAIARLDRPTQHRYALINVVADAVLMKPCDPDVLLENVKKYARAD